MEKLEHTATMYYRTKNGIERSCVFFYDPAKEEVDSVAERLAKQRGQELLDVEIN